MARHAKPRKRSTEWQGLGPTSGPAPFSPTQTQKMGERVRRVLADCTEASAKEMFLLWQVRLACLFRQALKKGQGDETSQLFRAIDKGKKAGHRLGFSEGELISLNCWVTGQDGAGELVELLSQVEGKLAEVKKN